MNLHDSKFNFLDIHMLSRIEKSYVNDPEFLNVLNGPMLCIKSGMITLFNRAWDTLN